MVVNQIRRAFSEMWKTPEYKARAEKLAKKAFEKVQDGDIEGAQTVIEEIQELYTMNKLYQNLD